MIYVLVERHVADGMESTYEFAARKALRSAYRDSQRPNHHYLLSKWRSIHDWKRWYYSYERNEVMNELNPTLADFEKVTLLEHSVY